MTAEELSAKILAACAACHYSRVRTGGFLCLAGRGCRRARVKKWLAELEKLKGGPGDQR